MSAYLVSRGHIRYLVEAALHLDQEGLRHYWHDGRSHYVNELTADDLGLMLWTECAKSVGARYPNDGPDDLPGPIGDGPRFGYVHVPMWHHSPVPVAVLKAIRCYTYQSCEHAERCAHEPLRGLRQVRPRCQRLRLRPRLLLLVRPPLRQR